MEASDIKNIRESLGLTQSEFSKRLGVSTQTISNWENGGKIPQSKYDSIRRLSTSAQIDQGGFIDVPDSEVLNTNPKPGEDIIWVPLINIDSVGGLSRNNDLTWRDQHIVRHIPFVDARPNDVAIYQSGDSMSPGMPAGSILHIRQVIDWQEYFGYGNTFVLWLKDDRRITKQVNKYKPDPKNYVTCHSFNPNYEDEELPKKFIRQVWKVITVLSDKGW